MIRAKDFQEMVGRDTTYRFAQWLSDFVSNYTFRKTDLTGGYFMLDKGTTDIMGWSQSESEIPDEFLCYETGDDADAWTAKNGYVYRRLNEESTKVFKDLGWQINDGRARNINVHFNSLAYTNREKTTLKMKYYDDVDISPLINLHDNLFNQFKLPEPNLYEFGEWFWGVATKHEDNLTDEEKSSQAFTLTEEELNKNYLYKNEYGDYWFYFPYSRYLKDNGWGVDGTTISWSQL